MNWKGCGRYRETVQFGRYATTCDRSGGTYFIFRIEMTQSASSATLTDPVCLPGYTMRSDIVLKLVGFRERPSGF
jgi:hypothetical protein